jgi:hypothetical protein
MSAGRTSFPHLRRPQVQLAVYGRQSQSTGAVFATRHGLTPTCDQHQPLTPPLSFDVISPLVAGTWNQYKVLIGPGTDRSTITRRSNANAEVASGTTGCESTPSLLEPILTVWRRFRDGFETVSRGAAKGECACKLAMKSGACRIVLM